jgi:hypothetical protein
MGVQPQKSVTLQPQLGGKTTKSIRDMWWHWSWERKKKKKLSVCWYHCISELENSKYLSLLHHTYNRVLASWRKLSPFHFQVLSNTTCHFPNFLENIATIQDKWWLACQMSDTSTIHLQRSIHSCQDTSIFIKFVNHFDAPYRDNELLYSLN